MENKKVKSHDIFIINEMLNSIRPKEQEKVEQDMESELNERDYILPSGIKITFNDQQWDALELLNTWIKGKDICFTLSGYAGSGKSTCVKKFMDTHKNYSFAVSAPTHKARKVIERMTDKPGDTIHALLGLKPDTDLDNFDPEKPVFGFKSEKKIAMYDVIILDEASMLNSGLYDTLLKEADLAGTKILFLADKAQIPPVKEKISKVFQIKNMIELTKVERTKDGNPLLLLFNLLRKNTEEKVDSFLHKTMLNTKEQGVEFTESTAIFRDKVLSSFNSQEYKDNPDFAKVICWTNKSVLQWNELIRAKIFGVEADNIVEDDILMAYSTVQGDSQYSPPLIENSGDYRVINVNKTMTILKDDTPIDIFRVTLTSTEENNPKTVDIIDRDDRKSMSIYYSTYKKFLNDALSAPRKTQQARVAWAKFYGFKRSILIAEDIKTNEGKVLVSKDIDYGYAITGHKSQGSTYTNVFIVEDDIDKNHKIGERARIKYVAFSRASEKVISLSQRTKTEEIKEEKPKMYYGKPKKSYGS